MNLFERTSHFLKRGAFYKILESTKGDIAPFLGCLTDQELIDNIKVWIKEINAPGWSEMERGAIKGMVNVMIEETFNRGIVPRPKASAKTQM